MKLFRFLLGAAIGASAALIVAPRTGAETRELLAKKINELTDGGAQDVYDRARETVTEKVDQVRPVAEETLDRIQASAAPVTEDVRAHINETRDRLAEQIVNSQKKTKQVPADVSDIAENTVEEISSKID